MLWLGIYNFYAVDILTLQDKPGYPVPIDGNFADNDNSRQSLLSFTLFFPLNVFRYFIGGTVLQRPSLTMINGVVIGAFGGHCDLYNYTGMLVAVSTTPYIGMSLFFKDARAKLTSYRRHVNLCNGIQPRSSGGGIRYYSPTRWQSWNLGWRYGFSH